MKVDAIEKIEKLVKDSLVVSVAGQEYTASGLKPVLYVPRPPTVKVHNLRGFCGFVNNDIDKLIKGQPHLIVVNSPKSVELISSVNGDDKKRTVFVEAELDPELQKFPFGQFMPQEEFAIRFRSLFVQKKGDDSEYVLAYASKLVGGAEIIIEDDGVTQKVQTKKGVSGALKESVALKPIVRLSPYRTFREVEQPESEFVFRARMNEGEAPKVALFEADGGAWINQATENIVEYIKAINGDIPVIA